MDNCLFLASALQVATLSAVGCLDLGSLGRPREVVELALEWSLDRGRAVSLMSLTFGPILSWTLVTLGPSLSRMFKTLGPSLSNTSGEGLRGWLGGSANVALNVTEDCSASLTRRSGAG